MNREPAVDLASAISWVDGDRVLLEELVAMFVDDVPRRLAEMRRALADDNASLLERTSHSLKGVLATFGAHRASALAAELERAARGAELSETARVLAAVDTELARITAFFADPGWRDRLP